MTYTIPEMKTGDRVTVYEVVGYMDGKTKVASAVFTVEGDANGDPLCLRYDSKKEHDLQLSSYGSRAVHFHELEYSEAGAVRRWRAEKLVQAVQAEQRAKDLRADLARPIRSGSTDSVRFTPDRDNPQMRVRVTDSAHPEKKDPRP